LGGFLLKPVLARERTDSPFAVGEILLGRFRVLRVTGEGGMAVVYEAFDEKVEHRIALKCPRLEFRNRLSPEAAKSLRVNDANVCRVFEVHTAETDTGDIDFLTMEFLEGETLAARLTHAPRRWLETPEGKEIAHQICAGLQAAHAAGVVHRDLKPGNVMLSTAAEGRPRATSSSGSTSAARRAPTMARKSRASPKNSPGHAPPAPIPPTRSTASIPRLGLNLWPAPKSKPSTPPCAATPSTGKCPLSPPASAASLICWLSITPAASPWWN
jgi:hypothetical protein